MSSVKLASRCVLSNVLRLDDLYAQNFPSCKFSQHFIPKFVICVFFALQTDEAADISPEQGKAVDCLMQYNGNKNTSALTLPAPSTVSPSSITVNCTTSIPSTSSLPPISGTGGNTATEVIQKPPSTLSLSQPPPTSIPFYGYHSPLPASVPSKASSLSLPVTPQCLTFSSPSTPLNVQRPSGIMSPHSLRSPMAAYYHLPQSPHHPLHSRQIAPLRYNAPSSPRQTLSFPRQTPLSQIALPYPDHVSPYPRQASPSPRHVPPSPRQNLPSPRHAPPSPRHAPPSPRHAPPPSPHHTLSSPRHAPPSPHHTLSSPRLRENLVSSFPLAHQPQSFPRASGPATTASKTFLSQPVESALPPATALSSNIVSLVSPGPSSPQSKNNTEQGFGSLFGGSFNTPGSRVRVHVTD